MNAGLSQPTNKKQGQLKLTDLGQKHSQAFSGIDVKTLMQLQIPDSVMREGILFIWVEKELISTILEHFETQGFLYVENVCYVMLDPKKEKCKQNSKSSDTYSGLSIQDNRCNGRLRPKRLQAHL